MGILHENWRALSIQQPWVDLILKGQKSMEVRYWRSLERRGAFLLHSSSAVDWKTSELLGYKDVLSLPLQRIVGYAEIEGVIKLDSENHLARLNEHWVVHPFNGEPLGAILRNVIAFEHPVACKGKRLFFSLPVETHAAISRQLGQIGIDAARDPSFLPNAIR